MRHICKLLLERDFDVICPNLLQRETPFEYGQDEIAYRNFTRNIGFVKAWQRKKSKYKKVYIVGFSVGATVAWLCSEEAGVDGIVGYYGSRIRNFVEIEPLCPTILFFPEREKTFNVDKLISILEKKHIEVHKFDGQHGFCDPFALTYHEKSALHSFGKMVEFLLKH